MATITFTIPDTAVPRVQIAFGHADPNNPGQWINATNQEVMDQLKAWMKGRTIDYEVAIGAVNSRNLKAQEVW